MPVNPQYARRPRIARDSAARRMMAGELVPETIQRYIGPEGMADAALIAGSPLAPTYGASGSILGAVGGALDFGWDLASGVAGVIKDAPEATQRTVEGAITGAYDTVAGGLRGARDLVTGEATRKNAADILSRQYAPPPAATSSIPASLAYPQESPFESQQQADRSDQPASSRAAAAEPVPAEGYVPSGGFLIYGSDGGRYGGENRVIASPSMSRAQIRSEIMRLRNKATPDGISFSDAPIPTMDQPVGRGKVRTAGGDMHPAEMVNNLSAMEEDAATAVVQRGKAEADIAEALQGYDLTNFGMPMASANLITDTPVRYYDDGRRRIEAPSGKAYMDEGEVVLARTRRELTHAEYKRDLDFVRRYQLAERDQGQALRAAAEQGSARYNGLPYQQAAPMQREHEARLAATPLSGTPRANEYYRRQSDFYTAPINEPVKADPVSSFRSGLDAVVREYDNIISSSDYESLTPLQRTQIKASRADALGRAIKQQLDEAEMMYRQGLITARQRERIRATAKTQQAAARRGAEAAQRAFQKDFVDDVRDAMKAHVTQYKDTPDESPFYDQNTGRIDRTALREAMKREVMELYQGQMPGTAPTAAPAQGNSPFAQAAAEEFADSLIP